jgi:DNA-binding beta-propeller fold protein YncE
MAMTTHSIVCRRVRCRWLFRIVHTPVPSRVGPHSHSFVGIGLPAGAVLIALILASGCSSPGEGNLRSPARVFGAWGRFPGRFIKPRAIAVNQWNEVFVVDRSGRIQKFDLEGTHLLTWNLEKVENGYPTGLGCDPTGDLWVADTHNSRILHYSRAGELVDWFGEHGEEPGQLVFPTDVLVSDDGFVFVTDYGGQGCDRVTKFRRDGSYVAEWGSTGTGPGQFQRAMGLCFDREKNIWVADSCNHRLQCLTQEGVFVRSVGGVAGEEPEFLYPYDVAEDSDGNLLVCEFGNHRVQRVTRDGRCLSIWGNAGNGPGQFHDPWGVCVFQREVFVVDARNHRIQVFSV